MSVVQKGIILTLEGETDKNGNPTRARVQSASAEGTSTLPIVIPWYLRGKMGNLEKGTEIAFVVFDDCTGIIVSRMDGNWDGTIDADIAARGNLTVEGDLKLGGRII